MALEALSPIVAALPDPQRKPCMGKQPWQGQQPVNPALGTRPCLHSAAARSTVASAFPSLSATCSRGRRVGGGSVCDHSWACSSQAGEGGRQPVPEQGLGHKARG